MSGIIKVQSFQEIDLADPFFDSLKEDYSPGFSDWYARKAGSGEKAYVTRREDNSIEGFLYLKEETGPVEDVIPVLPPAKRIKIGTFKIDPHGTKLGERFLKKIFDQAVGRAADEIYVTVYPKHDALIKLFNRYGFTEQATKSASNSNGDTERVLVRNMHVLTGDVIRDYPLIHSKNNSKYLLAIYPEFHTQLFPDSILNNETYDIVKDLSHTNSIHKVYVCKMDVDALVPGDLIVIYRTKAKDDTGSAEYRSVASSVCVVEDVKRVSDFQTQADFVAYCDPYSVFTTHELNRFYADRVNTRVIKMTYNAALSKRLIRRALIQDVGLDRDQRWGFFKISDGQFDKIVELGGINESLIVD